MEEFERFWYSGPIGPAPEGWRLLNGCSRVIPHNEEYEASWNDEMNEDHYRKV